MEDLVPYALTSTIAAEPFLIAGVAFFSVMAAMELAFVVIVMQIVHRD